MLVRLEIHQETILRIIYLHYILYTIVNTDYILMSSNLAIHDKIVTDLFFPYKLLKIIIIYRLTAVVFRNISQCEILNPFD